MLHHSILAGLSVLNQNNFYLNTSISMLLCVKASICSEKNAQAAAHDAIIPATRGILK
jgi:hypothetical protein